MQRSYRKKRRRKAVGCKNRRPGLDADGRARPGNRPSGASSMSAARYFPARSGKGGISAAKREGDGATPLAAMRILSGYFRAGGFAAARRTRLAMAPIGPALGWCEVPADRNYNRPVRMPYAASHERMRRDDRPLRRLPGARLEHPAAPPRTAAARSSSIWRGRACRRPRVAWRSAGATMRRLLPWLSNGERGEGGALNGQRERNSVEAQTPDLTVDDLGDVVAADADVVEVAVREMSAARGSSSIARRRLRPRPKRTGEMRDEPWWLPFSSYLMLDH